MAQVTVTVNNRSYTLACDDGEEAHLIQLAGHIDKRHADLVKDVGPAGDARLMLMASLTLADDLALANERIAELEEELAGLKDESLPQAKPKHLNGSVNGDNLALRWADQGVAFFRSPEVDWAT